MSRNQKIVWTVAIVVAYLLISIVGVGWMPEGTGRQTIIWVGVVVATGLILAVWLRPRRATPRG